MFHYTDPTDSNALKNPKALENYQGIIEHFYLKSARIKNSAFTSLEAFENISSNTIAEKTISWIAFPKTAAASFAEIDQDRFQWQDEYVEWLTEKSSNGQVQRITFTTEFPEYYEALAEVSFEALVNGIKEVIPNANPTVQELFGQNFDPAFGRGKEFRNNLRDNPWNNGEKGILCLGQPVNTMEALFTLIDQCAIAKPKMNPGDVCSTVACVPGRNSDPFVCVAAQNQALASRGISLVDPVGINMMQLGGVWELNGQFIDINNPKKNHGIWQLTRGGRRGVLNVIEGLTLDGSAITSGAQVSTKLLVGADVMTAPESALPLWARTGQESLVG